MFVKESSGEGEKELALFKQPDHAEDQKQGTQLLSLEVALANQQIGLLVIAAPTTEEMCNVWVQLFACRGNFDRLHNFTVKVFERSGALIQALVVEHEAPLYLDRFRVLPSQGFSMQLASATHQCTKTFSFI